MKPHPTRRGFLRQIVFGAAPVVDHAGAHTLVCIFLRGGADTLNMLVPWGDDDYYRNRPTLAIPSPGKGGADAAVKLDDLYAFHPKMAPLLPLYREGRLGLVQGVGSDNPTGSHFEAQDQIEHGEAYGHDLGGGWLGRHLRSRARGGDSPLAGVSIGPTLTESLRGAPAATAFHSIDNIQLPASAGSAQAVSNALAALYSAEVGLLGAQGKETLELLRRVEQLRGKPYHPENGASYPADEFGAALREVARIIKAGLGLEVACVDLNGWDTHFFQGTTGGQQATLIDRLSRGLAAFDADLKAHRDHVTTIVMTEFGRRLYENGSAGTDHGRAFSLMALGGKVKGGKVHGAWPGLKEEPMLLGPGGMEVKIDYRTVLAEVLTKAVGNAHVNEVFPDSTGAALGLIA